MIIGQRVKESRLNKGYTQEALGLAVGVSKVSICGYESGKRTPSMDMFIKLAQVLEVSVDYLLGNDFKAICDQDEEYAMMLAKEDIEILKELKQYKDLYNSLCEDPKRTIKLIDRKIN